LNSLRDDVKDAIQAVLTKQQEAGIIVWDDLKYDIADSIFDAIGITELEQDIINYEVSVTTFALTRCTVCGDMYHQDHSDVKGICQECIKNESGVFN
jgi:hypothetical protein